MSSFSLLKPFHAFSDQCHDEKKQIIETERVLLTDFDYLEKKKIALENGYAVADETSIW